MKLTKISLKKLLDKPEAGSKQASHAIIASDEKFENKTQVGKLWLKTGQYGNFLSGGLDNGRIYEGKEYDGYVIITEKEYNEYQTLKSSPSVKVGGYEGKIDDGSASVEEISF